MVAGVVWGVSGVGVAVPVGGGVGAVFVYPAHGYSVLGVSIEGGCLGSPVLADFFYSVGGVVGEFGDGGAYDRMRLIGL